MAAVVPNLFVVGVPKGGTTSLAKWLADHPAIQGGAMKELRYLMDPEDPLADPEGYHRNGLGGYGKHFPQMKPGATWALDASPQYYYQDTALQAIADMAEAHVVFVLRDPAERIYSLYRYALNNMAVLPPEMSFREFVDHARAPDASDVMRDRPMLRNAIPHGEYARYISMWFERVGRERVSVLLMEELSKRPQAVLRDLAGTLGIDTGFFETYGFPRENESFKVRNRVLHKTSRKLRKFIPSSLRKALAPVYGSLNTERLSSGRSEEDLACLAQLKADFRDHNADLGRLMAWPQTPWPVEARAPTPVPAAG
ncbi:MAG: sulfotransferase domain-containing protein [Pseudomonadota bacterium]